MTDKDTKNTDKWWMPEIYFSAATDALSPIVKIYCIQLLERYDDATMRQAKDEFWMRIADHYGFEINFKRE